MFGDRLKEIRKRHGYTQKQLLEVIISRFPNARMSQTSISALEKREYTPRGEVLVMLCACLEVTPSTFYGKSSGGWKMEIDRDRIIEVFTRNSNVEVIYRYTPVQDLPDEDLEEMLLIALEAYVWKHMLDMDSINLEEADGTVVYVTLCIS